MTTQIPDTVIINDISFNIDRPIDCIIKEDISPLNKYLEQYHPNLKFDIQASCCWRGYIATWEIKDDCLYLKGINGKINNLNVELYQLFKSKEIKAVWFTGSIRIAIGTVNYIISHTGYTSTISPKNIDFYIKNGKVVEIILEETVYNEDNLNILSETGRVITKDEMIHEILCYKAMTTHEDMPREVYYADADYEDDLPF